jgi:hypothetical protein
VTAATIHGVAVVAALTGLAGCAFLIARGRSCCVQCEQTFFDPIFWRRSDLCSACQTTPVRLAARVLAWAAVGLCVGLVAFGVFAQGAAGARALVASNPATLAAIVAMVAGYLAGRALRRPQSTGLTATLQYLVRSREGRDLKTVRESAGVDGAVARAGKVAVWAEAGQARADGLLAMVEAVDRKFVHLTGSYRPPLRLRLLAFEGMPGYERYIASWMPSEAVKTPYTVFGRRRYTLAISIGGMAQEVNTPERSISYLISWILTAGRLDQAARPWLFAGLGAEVMAATSPLVTEPSALRRWARAVVARGGREPFSRLAAAKWTEMYTAKDEPAAVQADILRFQSWALVQMLVEEHLGEFHAFLRALRAMTETEVPFARTFGCTGDEALGRSLERLANGDSPPHREPPDALKWKIDTIVIPKLSADQPSGARCDAVRTIGALGYLHRAETLIDLLADADEPVRRAARTALEDVAGELHGDAPSAWRAWLEQARAAAAR